MIRASAPLAVALAAAVLAACNADAGDFQSDAEKYIEDADAVSDALGVEFSDAECERPRAAAAGTTFTCVASGDDGNVWRFTAEIVGDDEYQITAADTVPARDEGGADTSAPPSSAGSVGSNADSQPG
ncbi:hypothetical protein [Desertimonas flava]|uniref:hypothetical protein n=1 Tax=Desertimonas flava TaxID=2064846 RepID=UPI0013C53816|nr:hypothetical protein [Desertimonas flava]